MSDYVVRTYILSFLNSWEDLFNSRKTEKSQKFLPTGWSSSGKRPAQTERVSKRPGKKVKIRNDDTRGFTIFPV